MAPYLFEKDSVIQKNWITNNEKIIDANKEQITEKENEC
jgi:hypothetical protein